MDNAATHEEKIPENFRKIKIEIKTKNSWLITWKFDDPELIENCVKETVSKLEIRPKIVVYNKDCYQNRNIGFFSNKSKGYKYSRRLAASKPLTPSLEILLQKVNKLTKSNFNGILINQYEDGSQSIGRHSDDEYGLGKNGVVGISYGSTRKFRIRNKQTGKKVKDIIMDNLSTMQMGGNFQKEFTHEIPVEKKVKEGRVSFTFRYHKE